MMDCTCSKFYCFWFLEVTILFGYVCVHVEESNCGHVHILTIEPKEIKDLGFTRAKDHISQLLTIFYLSILRSYEEERNWKDSCHIYLLGEYCKVKTLCLSVHIFSFLIFRREGNGTPLQYSCLKNPMDGGAWWAVVHGVAKSRTWLSDFTFTFHFHALEKEMATHFNVLA